MVPIVPLGDNRLVDPIGASSFQTARSSLEPIVSTSVWMQGFFAASALK